MAITASFFPSAGVLSVFDDNLNNTIVASRDAAGNILINGGAVAVTGGTADGRQHLHDPGVRHRRQRHDLARRNQRRAARRPVCSAAPATTR